MPDAEIREIPQQRSLWGWVVAMPPWKKAVLGAALLAMLGGGIWSVLTADAVPAAGESGGALATNLVPEGPRVDGTPTPVEPVSKGVFRLGFSFVAGFCIGSFLRAMVRVAAIAVGFWLVATILLSHYGLVTVNWQGIESMWDRFAQAVEHEWESFQTFMTGSLPSAGLAVAGLAVGLKRH